ncbi:hypothetical protein Pint_29296 [Pistacia integerrima]|uniref:Uncharacterized protein n=1 Tax=Pistacia integerrima TaxID=434235 RepID=A0ACC0X0I6_9ROSI|nr:hypothetical protein Pint_29296 [Pistacia integerrima]
MGVRSSKLSRLIGGGGGGRVKRLGGGRPQLVTPRGYVPICVGVNDDTKRFIVHTKALGDADFLGLLYKSAEEYGFCNQGVLRIPYEAKEFEDWMIRRTNRKGCWILSLGSCYNLEPLLPIRRQATGQNNSVVLAHWPRWAPRLVALDQKTKKTVERECRIECQMGFQFVPNLENKKLEINYSFEG